MRLIIDRFENEMAICQREDDAFIRVPRSELPPHVPEGAIISLVNGVYVRDSESENHRREFLSEKLKKALNKNP